MGKRTVHLSVENERSTTLVGATITGFRKHQKQDIEDIFKFRRILLWMGRPGESLGGFLLVVGRYESVLQEEALRVKIENFFLTLLVSVRRKGGSQPKLSRVRQLEEVARRVSGWSEARGAEKADVGDGL